MSNMKGFVRSVVLFAAAAVLAVSCSKDESEGSLAFGEQAVFLSPGGRVTVAFSASSNVSPSSFRISGKPDGWADPVIDATARTVTVMAPETFGDEADEVGTVVLSGTYGDSRAVSAKLFVGAVDEVALDEKGPANSYIVSRKRTRYTFDAMHKSDGSSLAAAEAGICWQTSASLIQYVTLQKDGRVSFYVDSTDGELKEGNALIAAYDAAGAIVWSWHLWVVDYDPEDAAHTVDFNGYTLMDRNLGALKNANGTREEILASYGLYYQWGRKDPFIGPSSYNASQGSSAVLYNDSDRVTTLKFAASDAETGTASYAVQHPTTFLTTPDAITSDWVFGASGAANRWAAAKTVDDPCPYGWQVAPAAAFVGLSIVEDLSAADASARYAEKYGWTLSGGEGQSLFLAAGYRTYLDGKISNIYDNLPLEKAGSRNPALYMQPWVGYYWSSDTSAGGSASALYFWFDKRDASASGIESRGVAMGRSNGMPVRCVRTK